MARQSGVARAAAYIDAVLAGDIPTGHLARLACERQRRDLARQGTEGFPYVFDPKRAERVVRFLEKLKHIEGRWRGTRIVLEGWQCFIVTTAYGWVHAVTGKRRFREVHIEVPRRNGKSVVTSGIGLYMVRFDGEPAARVYAGAMDLKQAHIVYRGSREMLALSKTDFHKVGVRHKGGNGHRDHIAAPNHSQYWPLARAAEGKFEGLNISCGIADEIHAHPDPYMVNALRSGMGNREQPLLWAITTAGTIMSGVGYEWRVRSEQILNGERVNERVFCIVYGHDPADPRDVLLDKTVWAEANPNLGVSITEDFLQGLAEEAQHSGSALLTFLVKHLCVWHEGGAPWLPMDRYDACDHVLDEVGLSPVPCWAGFDYGYRSDLCALAVVWMRERRWMCKHWYWIPASALEKSHQERDGRYEQWIDEGHLRVSGDYRIDDEVIIDQVIEELAPYNVLGFGHDKFLLPHILNQLERAGLTTVEIPQTAAGQSEPLKKLEAVIGSKQFTTDGNPVTRWNFANTRVDMDKRGNVVPVKGKDNVRKIDGLIATVNALSAGLHSDEEAPMEFWVWDDEAGEYVNLFAEPLEE